MGRALSTPVNDRNKPGQGVFFFFVVAPFCSCPVSLVSRTFFAAVPGCAKCLFFALAPCRRPTAQRGFSFLCLSPGPEQKSNSLGGVFFCSGPAERSRRPRVCNKKETLHTRGRQQKKNLETNDTGHKQKGATTKPKKRRLTHWPWTAMLTHFFSGATFPAGDFFFAAAPRGAHSLTVGWGDFGKALVIFFCCGPAEPGEPTTKNVWCTASGLKTRRPQQKKKTPLPNKRHHPWKLL